MEQAAGRVNTISANSQDRLPPERDMNEWGFTSVVQTEDHMKTYLFIREGMFYPIELPGDHEVEANALCNPGTLRVEDTEGNVLWTPPLQ